MLSDREKALSIEKDSQINVVVNRPGEGYIIDLRRVLQNIKDMTRIYTWVLVLCMCIGLCAPVLLYQFKEKHPQAVSVVTLSYDVNGRPVTDLTAPDGTELDLSQITSSFVLQNALRELTLSEEVSLTQLRNNITVERILTEDSRRQQEVASKMLDDKNNGAYAQLQSVKLTYIHQFVVTLNNGFGDPEARKKAYLPNDELRLLLDKILAAYNDYLAMTYAPFKLPGDEITIIDTDTLDIMESLDLLRTAMQDLYDYCDGQPADVKAYRSWQNGRSLNDWMQLIETVREINVDYLYSHVYANSIAKNQAEMLSKYRYLLREAQTKLDVANENIQTTAEILRTYKHDQIYLENQESDTSKSTRITTDYYNSLILQQARNYASATALEITIDDLNVKISNLENSLSSIDTLLATEELATAIQVCKEVYEGVCAQMEEIMAAPFYTTYVESSAAQSQTTSFLKACGKKMAVGAVIGAVIGCGVWFMAAFIVEIKRTSQKSLKGEVALS